MQQFSVWMEQAVESQLVDPTAMVLGTVDSAGRSWQRIVLCKGFDERGFVFYTNHDSNKARAIGQNAEVSLLFAWNALDRQVIASGVAQRLPQPEAQAYFASRPRESQIAAWASKQSRSILDREALEGQADEIRTRFEGQDVPLPGFWGGYRVSPHCVEFWQGGEHRLHDRFRYTYVEDESWQIAQLQP